MEDITCVMKAIAKNFPVGIPIEVKEHENNYWLTAKIVNYDWKEGKILIHYENPPKDEWICASNWNYRMKHKPEFFENPENKGKFPFFTVGDRVVINSVCDNIYLADVCSTLPYGLYIVQSFFGKTDTIVAFFEMMHLRDWCFRSPEEEHAAKKLKITDKNLNVTFKVGDEVLVNDSGEEFYGEVVEVVLSGMYRVKRRNGDTVLATGSEMILITNISD